MLNLIIDLFKKPLFKKPHMHKFICPVMHNGRYWMKCTFPGCGKVRDSYFYDGTHKIEKHNNTYKPIVPDRYA